MKSISNYNDSFLSFASRVMRRHHLAEHGQLRHNLQIVGRHYSQIYLSPGAIYKHGCLVENGRHDVFNVIEDILTQNLST